MFICEYLHGNIDPNNTLSTQTSCSVSLGISITALILLNGVSSCIFIVILFIVIKSRKKALKELHRIKAMELPGIYEELDYVVPPVSINTKENIAYLTKSSTDKYK